MVGDEEEGDDGFAHAGGEDHKCAGAFGCGCDVGLVVAGFEGVGAEVLVGEVHNLGELLESS